jgi:phosphatidylglycerol:prolipoprotein diacylglycerol transferase
MHQYLELGNGINIPLYNLVIGFGAIVGFLILEKQIKEKHIDFDTDKNIYISLIIASIFSFLGAKVFETIYKQQIINLHIILQSGITFYGGLILGMGSFYLINLILKTNNSIAFNMTVPSLIIGHAFGRIGCFLAGCCFGMPTENYFGVTFPNGSIPFMHYGPNIMIHPVQLYESIFLFILFFYVIKFVSFNKRTAFYCITYGIFRFFIEYLRGDYRGVLIVNSLSPSQVISVILTLFGFSILIIGDHLNKNIEKAI